MREPVDESTNAPDITVKRLRNGVCHTILTMENKRASFESSTAKWKEAVGELQDYLDRVPHAAKPDPAFEIGLVGIGRTVRFYCRQEGGKWEGKGPIPLYECQTWERGV
jgi:hypothetical protein